MNNLLDIVKEQGIVNLIMDYKADMELYDRVKMLNSEFHKKVDYVCNKDFGDYSFYISDIVTKEVVHDMCRTCGNYIWIENCCLYDSDDKEDKLNEEEINKYILKIDREYKPNHRICCANRYYR